MIDELVAFYKIRETDGSKYKLSTVIAGLFMSAIGIATIWIFAVNEFSIMPYEKFFFFYIGGVFFFSGLLLISLFLCTRKLKLIRVIFRGFYYLFVSALIFVLFPIWIVLWVCKKTKLAIDADNFVGYIVIGGLAFSIAVIGMWIARFYGEKEVLLWKFNVPFLVVLIMIVAIVSVVRFSLFLWRKCSKRIDNEKFKEIKNDFYVFRFVIIMLCTVALNLFELKEWEETVKAMNGVFAIYLAMDRLVSKFRNVHSGE